MLLSRSGQGITTDNRRRLTQLLRAGKGPFTVEDAAGTLDMPRTRARRFLAYLAGRGWLTRVRPGLYATVPLEAFNPSEWTEDPWVVAAQVFGPCYVGGWSACEHWGLTDQLFRDVVILSTRWQRHRSPVIQGTSYRVKVIKQERMFGTRIVWRGGVRIQVSDPARTVLDLLDDPGLGGGIRHIGEIVRTWFEGESRNDDILLEYAERLGNRSVYKRLGFLIERLHIQAPAALGEARRRMSKGVVRLDPTGPEGGRRVSRWNLIANVTIGAVPA
ncbi:MAG: type IV toxin-antitoxin system AbiEi family antitoxin domain-containing protein [Longimicrobiales bacterium]|nr:type IV toxin-antitoxin system AbiEi family antitoxin domain-containing protein [Longimicrobiales bacterium]